MPERKKVPQEVDRIGNYDLDGPLDGAVQRLVKLKELHPEGFISTEPIPYEDGYYFSVRIMRDETDGEMNKRIAEEERIQNLRDERDRKEFERLSKKFKRD